MSTAEPWTTSETPRGRRLIHDDNGGTVAEVYDVEQRDRIVACVNTMPEIQKLLTDIMNELYDPGIPNDAQTWNWLRCRIILRKLKGEA